MGVTSGKKSPKRAPKGKSPAVGSEAEPMEIKVTSPKKKTPIAATEKAVTPQSSSNGLEKKTDSKKKKSLKRKLDDDDYEEKMERVKNSEAVVSEDDLNASQKGSSKKQKKKKQKVDTEAENKSSSSAKKAGLTSGDEKEDEEGGAVPCECKLFVTSFGLEGMTKPELKDFFKSHGYNLVLNIKQNKSRHAFVGFATEDEAKRARESLDKTDCRGFPLSVDSKDVMLSALKLIRPKPARLINKDGSPDCILYVSPTTREMTKQTLIDSFVGVAHVYFRRGKKKVWARLECLNSAVAKELHRSNQGKVVEGTALRLETPEEFRKRITEEETKKVKQEQEQKKREKKMEKKLKQMKEEEEKKSKPKPKEDSDQSESEKEEVVGDDDDDDDDEDDVKAVNDDDDSEEEVPPPKKKKAKVAGKR